MANYAKGPLGAFSGKVGNFVGANWRSIHYMRSLPRPSNKPATEKQKERREIFKMAYNFLSQIRDILEIGYPTKRSGKKSAFDLAMATTMSAIEGTFPDLRINYKNVVLSQGGLSPIRCEFSSNAQKDLILTWKPLISIGTAEEIDLINVVLYKEKSNDFYVEVGKRGDGTLIIKQNEINGSCFHIWTFVSTYNDSRLSNSMYHGEIKIEE